MRGEAAGFPPAFLTDQREKLRAARLCLIEAQNVPVAKHEQWNAESAFRQTELADNLAEQALVRRHRDIVHSGGDLRMRAQKSQRLMAMRTIGMDENVEAPVVTPGKEIVRLWGRLRPQLKKDKDSEENHREHDPHAARRRRLGNACASGVRTLACHDHS